MKTGNLAKRLDVSPSTIRFWAGEYAEHLSDSATGRAKGAPRVFTDRDGLVLATVADLRAQGLTHEQIADALEAGRLVDALPDLPTAEEEEARQSVALVPVAELHRALDRIRVMQDEMERLIEERDREAIAREEANRRIAALSAELGRAKGMLFGSIAVIVILVASAITLAMLLAKYLPTP